MLDALLLLAASVPFGIGLHWYAERLWQAIEKRDREDWTSPRPPHQPTED